MNSTQLSTAGVHGGAHGVTRPTDLVQTAYERGWHAGYRGLQRKVPADMLRCLRADWERGYDDAARGVIDAPKFLGRHFRGAA